MNLLVLRAMTFLFGVTIMTSAGAQTFTRPSSDSGTAAQLQALAKKIDEQNSKIDTLSQQILKLEQQLANTRPGVMIGEATPAPLPASAAPDSSVHTANGSSHTVARGETLTSIAKMHNVTVGELQKFNHIENDRKLQIGQTIMIPVPPVPGSSSSPN